MWRRARSLNHPPHTLRIDNFRRAISCLAVRSRLVFQCSRLIMQFGGAVGLVGSAVSPSSFGGEMLRGVVRLRGVVGTFRLIGAFWWGHVSLGIFSWVTWMFVFRWWGLCFDWFCQMYVTKDFVVWWSGGKLNFGFLPFVSLSPLEAQGSCILCNFFLDILK